MCYCRQVSVLARAHQGKLGAWATPAGPGYSIEMLQRGALDAAEMIAQAER